MIARRLLPLFSLPLLFGCATLQQIRALDRVEFSIGGVSDVRLDGIDMTRVNAFSDLGLLDVANLAAAVQSRSLPLSLRVNVLAENPADNFADARLLRMDWTLFLQSRETLSGTFAEETRLPRGEATNVPILVELNLIDFFGGSSRDLFELALSLAGAGGQAKEVTLEATPVIDTPFGPIVYPDPITIVSREVG